jgi:hypothetical protein
LKNWHFTEKNVVLEKYDGDEGVKIFGGIYDTCCGRDSDLL